MNQTTTMKRALLLVIMLFSLSLTGVFAQKYHADYQDGKLYLKFKESEPITFIVDNNNQVNINSVPLVRALAQTYVVQSLSRPFYLNDDPRLLRTLMLEIDDYKKIDEVIDRLKDHPQLEYVEKVPLDRIDFVPNDSLYILYNGPNNWNWHLELINAEQAWDVTRGDANIKVAVVDNAVWTDHPDLAGKIVLQRDVYYGNNNPNPPGTGDPGDWSHGTHVAGLIGAASNNGIGIASIGYNVSIIAVKASNNTQPRSISAGYQGVQWAANNGADVINMSWGGPGFSQTNQNLMNTVANMGIVLIAAAGNDNVSAPHYPSAYNNVLSIASIDWNDVKSSFSNYSTTVDLSSPGGIGSPGPSGVLSTTYSSGQFGNYDAYIGTSMASPVAAGVAALILSVNPDLTPAQVESIMKTTSADISTQNPTYIGLLGSGRIDAYAAVINTPFEPTAAFYTPVEVILPGTSIDFYNESTGVPSEYEWTFEGATPSTSNDTNPQNILYHTAGTYDVTLTVTNEFGTSTVTYFDYVQVVTSPTPYVDIAVSDSLPCIAEPVILYDSSLYGPSAWNWVIEPNTYEFVNGTNANSENPEIVFLRQGYYSVSLTATNANGFSTKTFEHMVNVQGVAPDYVLDMEDGTSGYFIFSDSTKSQTNVDLRAANNSSWGMHFHGDPIPVGWKGSATATTAEQAWVENAIFISQAHLCGVDAREFTNIKLAFDLRQTYSLGPKFSWFRVLINGEPVQDYNGTENFNPVTAGQDPWTMISYDLSEYAGEVFDITLQASTRFSDKAQGEGDNVFIDNIQIVNSVSASQDQVQKSELQIFPNPSVGKVYIRINNQKDASLLEILNAQGSVMFRQDLINGTLQHIVNVSDMEPGFYLVRVSGASGILTGKLVVGD